MAEFLSVQRFFERTELALVSANLKPGMSVIDVGANIGLKAPAGEQPSGQCVRARWTVRVALAAHASTSVKLKSDAGFGDAYRYLSPEGLRVKTTGVTRAGYDITETKSIARDCSGMLSLHGK